VIGVFDTAEAAYLHGVERFGNAPFLVKRIQRDDMPVQYVIASELDAV
jgi:hypothetical protein